MKEEGHLKIWSVLALGMLALVLAACDGGSTTESFNQPVDRDVILNSLEDVRAMVQRHAGAVEPAAIGDVDYSDGELTVTLSETHANLDLQEMEGACRDISSSIALIDLRVRVEKLGTGDSVECTFQR